MSFDNVNEIQGESPRFASVGSKGLSNKRIARQLSSDRSGNREVTRHAHQIKLPAQTRTEAVSRAIAHLTAQ